MNYLSHFYLDRQSADSLYILGAVLPDLTRNHDPKLRIKAHTNIDELPSALHSLQAGVNRHYAVDAVFHNSLYFKSKVQELKKILQHGKVVAFEKYTSFYAHIILELMLDRVLVNKDRALADQFYAHIEQADRAILKDYFAQLNMQDHYRKFSEFLDWFISAKYLYKYADDESLVYAIGRIHQRIRKVPLSTADESSIIALIPKLETYVSRDYLTAFEID